MRAADADMARARHRSVVNPFADSSLVARGKGVALLQSCGFPSDARKLRARPPDARPRRSSLHIQAPDPAQGVAFIKRSSSVVQFNTTFRYRDADDLLIITNRPSGVTS